jgi:cytoskeletal protein CcmA (bactofilin family)
VPRPAPAVPKRADIPAQPARQASEQRKLIVGQGIAFSGEIGACDHLIVEGAIEAKLPEGNRIDIAVTGVFRGTASAEEVDIAGRFEGELTVKGRLTLRSTGRVDGKIQYGELAVEAGGTIDGEIRTLAKPAGN